MARAVPARAWGLIIAVAVGVHATAFLLLSLTPVRDADRTPQPRGARWVGERMGDNIDLIDPEPLFLPTRWNAGAKLSLDVGSADPGAVFKDFEPGLSVSPGRSPAGLVALPEGVRTAGVAIRRFARPLFLAFGEVDRKPEPVSPRVALIEVRDAATGLSVLRREISAAEVATQAGGAVKWPHWVPFSMLIVVEPTGMLGLPLVPAPGSDVEMVDAFFRTHLRGLLRPDLMLPAGYYRVVVSP